MRKKLLCLLLSIAMVSTAADSLVLAAEDPIKLQTAIEETQKDASDTKTDTEAETKEEDSDAEVTETDPESDEEITGGEVEPESDEETTGGEVDPESDEEAAGGKTEPESDEETTGGATEPESDEETTEGKPESDEESTVSENDVESAGETTDSETEETAGQGTEDKADREETAAETKLQAEYHSASEIIEFLNREKAGKADAVTYAEKPDLAAPYQAGALSDTTLESAAAMIRQVRFIAGLPYELQLNDEYNHISQAAALLSSVNQELSREPSRPEGMSEELFEQGREGVSNSNLAYTDEQLQTLNGTIIETWMADQDEHSRRGRLLNPSMDQIGFGAVKDSNGMYSAMYTADRSDKDDTVFGVAWPAQNMPVDYFDRESLWSVSTGETLEASDIRVTLTREADEKNGYFPRKSQMDCSLLTMMTADRTAVSVSARSCPAFQNMRTEMFFR